MVKTFVNIHTSTCQIGESIGTEALGLASLESALRVGSAVQIFARVATVVADVGFGAQAALVGVADGVAGAVVVVLARDDGDASDGWVGVGDRSLGAHASVRTLRVLTNRVLTTSVGRSAFIDVEALFRRIACEAWWTGTLIPTAVIRADRVDSAHAGGSVRGVALIDVDAAFRDVRGKEGPALFADTKGFVAFRLAVGVRAALDVFTRRLAWESRWCSDEPGFAIAFVRPWNVLTDGAISANVGVASALVDIHADRSRRFESLLAETLAFDTLGVVCAVEVAVAQNINVSLLASNLGIGLGSVSLGTNAIVAGRRILTDCVVAARFLHRRTLVDVHAAPEGVAGEFWSASTHIASGSVSADGIQAAWIFKTLVDI